MLLLIRNLLLILGLTALALLQPSLPGLIHAQAGMEQWSQPEVLLPIPDDGSQTEPYVFTGSSNNTYLLFFGRPQDDPKGPVALYYARWLDGHWSPIRDVLVAPEATVPWIVSAVEDAQGYLYVVWDAYQAWYSYVPVAQADDARAWSAPLPLLDMGVVNYTDAAVDSSGVVHAVISTTDGNLYSVRISSDGRLDRPVLVYALADDRYYLFDLSVVATKQGSIHTCWDEHVNQVGRSRGVFCSTSHDGGTTWTSAEQIAQDHRGITLFYFERSDLLARIVYGGVGVGGRTLQLSQDDGQTWSGPVDLTQKTRMEGFSGQVAAMDSAGVLHVMVNEGGTRYAHSALQGGEWTANRETNWAAPDWIKLAVAEGNTLVVAYWVPGSILSSHLKVDAPYVPPGDLPVAVARQTRVIATPTTPAPNPTPRLALDFSAQTETRLPETFLPVAGGIVPAILLVLVVVLVSARRAQR